ncbi:MAG: hypothetical protein ACRDLO_06970 [Solirubrobacterales bacterium]
MDAGRLVEQLDLGEDGEAAAAEYSRREAEYRDRKGFEIVLVGADSIETIRQTHAHYFNGTGERAFDELLAGCKP